jgi:hypothetical protein
LANLAGADTKSFVDGVGALFNPRIARVEPKQIEDREPAVTARIKDILIKLADGKLTASDFAYVRAGFFPNAANRLSQQLKPLGEPQRLDLFERTELGDDRVYQYEVVYPSRTLVLRIALAPGDKVSQFGLRPKGPPR